MRNGAQLLLKSIPDVSRDECQFESRREDRDPGTPAAARDTAPVKTVLGTRRQERRDGAGRGGRRLMRGVSLLCIVACAVGWFVLFRPQILGGPAEFIAIDGVSMTPTMHNGDLAILEKRSSYHVGEVVAYRIPAGEFGAGHDVIHRIVGGNGKTGFVTKGDHNAYSDYYWHPTAKDVIGKVWFTIPRGAYLLSQLRRPAVLAAIVAASVFLLVSWPVQRRARRHLKQDRKPRHLRPAHSLD